MITSLVTLHSLDDENAVFVGDEDETFTRQHPFGQFEVEGHYPAVFLLRSTWEAEGRPTLLVLRLEIPSDVPDEIPEEFER